MQSKADSDDDADSHDRHSLLARTQQQDLGEEDDCIQSMCCAGVAICCEEPNSSPQDDGGGVCAGMCIIFITILALSLLVSAVGGQSRFIRNDAGVLGTAEAAFKTTVEQESKRQSLGGIGN